MLKTNSRMLLYRTITSRVLPDHGATLTCQSQNELLRESACYVGHSVLYSARCYEGNVTAAIVIGAHFEVVLTH